MWILSALRWCSQLKMLSVTMAEFIVEGKASPVDTSPVRFTRFPERDLLKSSYHHRVLV